MRRTGFAFLAVWLLLGGGGARADSIGAFGDVFVAPTLVGPGTLGGPGFDTGVRVLDTSGQGGEVTAFIDPTPFVDPIPVAGGFLLLDGTLTILSTLPIGGARYGIRMEYARKALERAGLRESSLRLFRFDSRLRRWIAVGEDRLPFDRFDFTLGRTGFSAQETYVWATVSDAGVYAIGAAPVPEPASLLLMGIGAALLLVVRRRRT